TGPVLAVDDPAYRGIRVPRRFYKIAAWAGRDDGTLHAAGFVLDQGPALDDIDVGLRPDAPPPLGPFLTYQVPIPDIARLTGLELATLVPADRYAPPAAAPAPERWTLLERYGEIRL